jgi:DNA repair protein RecN (Recombination protein N)
MWAAFTAATNSKMLCSLSVRNFAIIDRLDLEFGPGLNVLTGETGAGKSIIMQALNLILGGRAGADMVRTGSDRASVDAVFEIGRSPEVEQLVRDMGYDADDGQLLLSREVNSSGKSSCRVAGRPSTVAQLKEIGDWLVDLHGQHEHQSLLSVAKHIDILDAWGGPDIQASRKLVGSQVALLQRLRSERHMCETGARERAQMLDLYKYQLAEITAAKLERGEETTLETEYRRAANAQRLAELACGASEAVGGGDSGGAIGALAAATRLLEEAVQMDDTLQPALEAVRSAGYELSETERDLIKYQDSIDGDPERLGPIEERLELVRSLRRKYGDSVEEVIEYSRQAADNVERLSNSEEKSDLLGKEIAATEKALGEECARLTELRRNSARQFEQIVSTELESLAMTKSRFQVRIDTEEPTSKGTDRVEFLIAVNAGEPVRPLVRVASGGEISRVMLAIKSAMARQEALPTMVFDEVDVGVGGRTAGVIADKLETLARSAQVLCITHLAQLASRGQFHFYIEKTESIERTFVSVVPVTGVERIAEIARMIGGSEVTDTVLRHAREMLGAAEG